MYQCDYCNYESTSKFNVARHEAKKHNLQLKNQQQFQNPAQVHRPGEQQHHHHPVHVHQAKAPVHVEHVHQQSLVAQNQYLQNKINELQRENEQKTQLLQQEYASKERVRLRKTSETKTMDTDSVDLGTESILTDG